MKVSRKWLQQYIEEELPSVEEIAEKLTMYAFEIESIESDDVFDTKTLADRNHYALSHYGVASEIANVFGFRLREREEIILPQKAYELDVDIQDTSLCRRYTAAILRGVKVGPSPEWLRQALESVGQRSINNIVDATNYVMLSTGQPTHAFDISKLGTTNVKIKIAVKKLEAPEKITALDDKEYELKEGTLVIADVSTGKTLAIAGVKGGKAAAVTEKTIDILLESANFDPIIIRKTGRSLGLITDAQKRFENELTPDLALQGLSDVIRIIEKVTTVMSMGGYVDIYPEPVQEWNVQVSLKEINDLLGTTLKAQEVEDIINRFQWKHECVTVEGTRKWSITPPFERLDIKIKEDVIEEIGRVYGYEHVHAKIPEPAKPLEINRNYVWCETLKSQFIASGYSEVITYAFRKKGDVEIAYPLAKDKAFLRKNLKDGVTEALEFNKKNKDILGLKEIKIFEIGNIFTADKEEMHVCFANEKEVVEMTLKEAVEHMKIEDVAELPEIKISENKYTQISQYPYIVRDIAVWVPESTQPEEITKMIIDDSGELLVKGPMKFDEFSKDGKTSYAYRMVYQSMERTLTIEEVNDIITKITEKMNTREGWKVR